MKLKVFLVLISGMDDGTNTIALIRARNADSAKNKGLREYATSKNDIASAHEIMPQIERLLAQHPCKDILVQFDC